MRRRVSNALAVVALEKGSRPLVWRWVTGTLVLLVAAVCVSAWIDNDIGGGNWWGISIAQAATIALAGFVAGLIIRRWAAASLALLPILVAIPFGLEDPSSVDPYFYSREPVVYMMALLALGCAVCIAAGIVAAIVIEFLRARRPAAATS
jgi:hypothetical protein